MRISKVWNKRQRFPVCIKPRCGKLYYVKDCPISTEEDYHKLKRTLYAGSDDKKLILSRGRQKRLEVIFCLFLRRCC